MFNYTLQELNKLAKNNKFVRDTLEKVLRLSDILEIFNTNDILKNKYVLKGGTAINLCIFDFPRLSVDIDMNFNDDCSRDEMIKQREVHARLIEGLLMNEGYFISENSRHTHTLDSYLLKYTNAVGNQDNIKIELNYSNRVQIIEPIKYKISNKIIKGREVLGNSLVELYGSKIAALLGRTTARDLYDVYQMIQHEVIKSKQKDLLRKCTIFYLTLSNDDVTIEEMISLFMKNLGSLDFRRIRRNLIPVLHTDEHVELDEMKRIVLRYIEDFLNPSDKENEFVTQFRNKEYQPELLFNKTIASRIVKHPMAIWKTRN